MDMRIREAVRYLGYGKCAVDEKTMQVISESFKELDLIADEKSIYRIFEISVLDEHKIQSKNLQKNLTNCKEVILFAATLGTEVDRWIRKYEILDMSKAVIFQACATAYLEEYCDAMQKEISVKMKAEGKFIRPRFSPGYGDFSVLHQKDFLAMLDASKQIGLTMTDGYMLTPTKSITAVIGISQTDEQCHVKGCEACKKTDCIYRRGEKDA